MSPDLECLAKVREIDRHHDERHYVLTLNQRGSIHNGWSCLMDERRAASAVADMLSGYLLV
jgi:hypothetical protein